MKRKIFQFLIKRAKCNKWIISYLNKYIQVIFLGTCRNPRHLSISISCWVFRGHFTTDELSSDLLKLKCMGKTWYKTVCHWLTVDSSANSRIFIPSFSRSLKFQQIWASESSVVCYRIWQPVTILHYKCILLMDIQSIQM